MLTRTRPLKRTPMKRTQMRRAQRRRVKNSFRADLARRSNGECEAQLSGCLLVATDVCHRLAKKMGGRPDDGLRLSNVWHGCRACHQWTHARPTESYDLGLALREGQDPEAEPMAYCNTGFVYLDDLGFVWPVTE